jgi:hypothetical protein
MDVSPCNPLLDLWFVALVLSKTLNGSSEGKKTHSRFLEDFKGRQIPFRPFLSLDIFDMDIVSSTNSILEEDGYEKNGLGCFNRFDFNSCSTCGGSVRKERRTQILFRL